VPPKVEEKKPEITPPTREERTRGRADDETGQTAAPTAKPGPVESGVPLKSRLTQISSVSRSQISPELLELARKFPAAVEADATTPPPDPLFHPRWARGIVTAALSTPSPDGPIDIERLIENLSHRDQLVELPRLDAPTMRRGLQLLVDLGAGMAPYAQDVASFQKEIRLIAGNDGVQTMRFNGSPLLAGPSSKKTWTAYQPPPRGTPVLALTDLGINRPANAVGPNVWLEFAQILRHAECPLVVFTPCSTSRWPDDLVRSIHIIQWDRGTTVTAVRRLIGRSLAVKR
jgi:hypothetical protein